MVPTDANMLLSYVNTKLRDEYCSLDALCEDLDLNLGDIIARLESIGYTYDRQNNRFVVISP